MVPLRNLPFQTEHTARCFKRTSGGVFLGPSRAPHAPPDPRSSRTGRAPHTPARAPHAPPDPRCGAVVCPGLVRCRTGAVLHVPGLHSDPARLLFLQTGHLPSETRSLCPEFCPLWKPFWPCFLLPPAVLMTPCHQQSVRFIVLFCRLSAISALHVITFFSSLYFSAFSDSSLCWISAVSAQACQRRSSCFAQGPCRLPCLLSSPLQTFLVTPLVCVWTCF